jgi:hypothetical protein
MHFCYRGCTVDATSYFSQGRYVARARIEFPQALPAARGNATYASDDLGDFDSAIDAVDCARRWAIAWIDERLNPVTYQ